ncbi:MAG: hypothetical protein D6772_14100 [Bacteroidetes bacterium]|nr:MAG: hypothetical protein D6772_14100 [Bacteroidota bacterium]
MNHFKLPLFLLVVLVLAICLTFFSSAPGKGLFAISGHIEVLDGTEESFKVYFLEEGEDITPANLARAHHKYTDSEGNFATEMLGAFQSTVQLVFEKEGYPLVVEKIALQVAADVKKTDKQHIHTDEPIYIGGKIGELNINHHYGQDPNVPALSITKQGPCNPHTVWSEVPKNEILYLQNIFTNESLHAPCFSASGIVVGADILTTRDTKPMSVLMRLPNGKLASRR